MDSRDDLTTEALSAAAEKLSSGIATAQALIAEEERQLSLLTEEYRLICRLLELRTDEPPPDGDASLGESTFGPPALDAALEELTSAGRPLHISELFRTLREHSVPIPGSGQQANLIALLTRDARIYRPERGFYALSQWRSEKPPSSTRTRRVHVRARGPENETKND